MTKTKLLIAALVTTVALSAQAGANDTKEHKDAAKSMKCGEGKCGSKMKEKEVKPSKCGADHMKENAGKCAGKSETKKDAHEAHDH